MEDSQTKEDISKVLNPILPHETTNNLSPVIIVSSFNVEQSLVDKLQFSIDVQKEFCIGRNPLADMDIRHPAVSRNHCIITFFENKALIKNMSSVGMYVNEKFIEDKYDTHFLNSGDKIVLSKSLQDFILNYYESTSHISPGLSETLKQNTMMFNNKRKMLTDSDQNVDKAKKPKQASQNNQKKQQLTQEKVTLDESYSERISLARQNYDSQVLNITSDEAKHQYSAEDIQEKVEQLKQQFNEERNNIEAEYALQIKKWEAKCLEMEENCEELKAKNNKLTDQICASEKKSEELIEKLQEFENLQNETQDLRARLKQAEEMIKIGKEELDKENKDKQEIIEKTKQLKEELDKENKDKQEIIEKTKQLEKVKQEALKNCLVEKEAIKRELVAKYECEIQSLHVSQMELEKKILQTSSEKNTESESIINQLNDELDSVRQLLTIHESERQLLESEVQTKIKDFAEVLESEAQCTICSEIFVDAVTLLGCFHTFCQTCISQWKKQKQECPICRQKILKNQERRNFTIDSWIKSFIVKMSPSMKSARAELIKTRAQHAQSVGAPSPRPAVPATAAVRHAAVQGTAPRTPVAHVLANGARIVRVVRPRPRGNARRLARVIASVPIHTYSLNAYAPEFVPLTESGTNAPNLLNNVPIYVSEEPLGRPNLDRTVAMVPQLPINENPILISDEEEL